MKQFYILPLLVLCLHGFAQTKPAAPAKAATKPKTSVHHAKPAAAKPTPPPPAPAPQPEPQPAPAPQVQAAPQAAPAPQTQTKSNTLSNAQIESVWISGSIGAGGVISTNVINTGAMFIANGEILFQKRHHRLGLGFSNELYVTPEALGRFIMGEGIGVKKLYFAYEVFVFRNFPINLGFSSHLGFFGAGNESSNRGGAFGNVGAVLEVGARPVYLFVRPSLEYKSWSGFHKEICATASVGLRFKFLTDYEIQRRAEKKRDRDHRF